MWVVTNMKRFLAALPAILVSASLVACAVKGGAEDSSSSSNAISASPALIRACSAAGTYSADGPNDFDTPATDKVPAVIRKDTDIVHFKAPIVGDVYASGGNNETDGVTFLYDVNGRELGHGYSDGTNMLWFDANDVALDCSSTPYNVHTIPTSSSSSTGGDWTDASVPVEMDGGTDWTDASTDNTSSSSSSGGWNCPGCVLGDDGGIMGNQH